MFPIKSIRGLSNYYQSAGTKVKHGGNRNNHCQVIKYMGKKTTCSVLLSSKSMQTGRLIKAPER